MYLIYHINKGLSVISIKRPNRLGILVVREDVRNQGPALGRSGRVINQGLPRWDPAAALKAGQADTHGSGAETYKPHETLSACGRRWASLFQHRCISVHISSVKAGWIGRGGRSPRLTADLASCNGLSLNGRAQVKAFAQTNDTSSMISLEC